VIGITDYFTIEGYKKVKAYLNDEKRFAQDFPDPDDRARIRDILVLANVEFRLNFLINDSRVNFHVLFSDKVSVEDIEENFLHDVHFVYEGNPQSTDEQRKLTVHNLIALGERLKREHANFASQSDIEIGLCNAVVDASEVCETLNAPRSLFSEKFLVGVPADEDLSKAHWDGQGHNSRKVLIQKADFLMAANPHTIAWALGKKHATPADYAAEFKGLKPCLHGSDAHTLDTLFRPDQDRCCWIKADPTFDGLRQVTIEPEERVYIGEEPDSLSRVRSNRTKYIASVEFGKISDSTETEVWFSENGEIPVNPGLVAVIGNKGSGKSALADTLGLIGNTRQSEHFSFLSKKKFREKGGAKASQFIAVARWESGDTEEPKTLNDETDEDAAETIKCLPQKYLEEICSDEITAGQFYNELKAMIFSHIDKAETLDCDTLDEVIEVKTGEKNRSIEIVRRALHQINADIIALEEKLHPDQRKRIEAQRDNKKREKASLEKAPPEEVPNPEDDAGTQRQVSAAMKLLTEKKEALDKVEETIRILEGEKKTQYERLTNAKLLLDRLANFRAAYDTVRLDCQGIAAKLGIEFDEVLKVAINEAAVKTTRSEASKKYGEIQDKLDEENKQGVLVQREKLQEEIRQLSDTLDEPQKKYQAYLVAKQAWKAKLEQIEGDADAVGSLQYYTAQLEELKSLPESLAEKKKERISRVKEIYGHLHHLTQEYAELYQPVKKRLGRHGLADGMASLDFSVAIVCQRFENEFLGFIDQNKRGSFRGKVEGQRKVRNILGIADFSSEDGVVSFLDTVEEQLAREGDGGDTNAAEVRYVKDQLKQQITVLDFYDYVYSLGYLLPKYTLRWGDREVGQLSPGERGTVLLIFYLFLSTEDIPLVIDQPEENLDNETVYKLLVPCIKWAKKRRQIILVTHNPNLAVVCDADQVIHCQMDKTDGNRITYQGGAIENPKINRALITILEGTRPAFDNRDSKYYVADAY